MAYEIPITLKDKLTTAQALHDLAVKLKTKTDELEAAIEESKQGGELNKIDSVAINGKTPTPSGKAIALEIQKNGAAITATQSGNKVTVNVDVSEYATTADVNAKLSAVYKPAGSKKFAELPQIAAITKDMVGNVYNITDDFTTNANFVEGANKKHPAGTNVVIIEDSTYKFDVLAGFVDLSPYAKTADLTKYAPAGDYVEQEEFDELEGRVDAIEETVEALPTHPNITAQGTQALYKIAYDKNGHITGATKAAAADIMGLHTARTAQGNSTIKKFTTDAYGHVISATEATVSDFHDDKGVAKGAGFYTITTDAQGHVTAATAVTAANIRNVANINFSGTDAGLVPTATANDAAKVLSGAGAWIALPEIASKEDVDGMLTGIFGA